jgi:RNA polymerase sigma factor (sigma-70 family)
VEVSRSGGEAEASKERSQGLTREGLEALLAHLDPNRERAGERYEEIRRRLVRLFEWRGCASPEDLADETFNRVARRMAEGVELRSSDPYGYFCGVAHLVYKEVLRRSARERTAFEGNDWPPEAPEETGEDERLDALRQCLGHLTPEQHNLVLLYHRGEDNIRSRKELSAELGIPMNALRIRVHRLRRKLEECVQERLRR